MRLAAAFRYDLKLQFRHGFYYAYLVVCLIYVVIIRNLPAGIQKPALTLVLLTDPSVLGFFFIGGIVLLEKGQNTLEGLFITPIRMQEYLWSKVLSLTVLALFSSYLIVIASVGFSFNPLPLLLGVTLTSVLFVFLGFTLVSITKTINGYLLTSPLYAVIAMLPVIDYLGILQSPWFYLIPTKSSLVLMDSAFRPYPAGELLLSMVLLAGSIWLSYLWASKWFYRYIVLKTGVAL